MSEGSRREPKKMDFWEAGSMLENWIEDEGGTLPTTSDNFMNWVEKFFASHPDLTEDEFKMIEVYANTQVD